MLAKKKKTLNKTWLLLLYCTVVYRKEIESRDFVFLFIKEIVPVTIYRGDCHTVALPVPPIN